MKTAGFSSLLLIALLAVVFSTADGGIGFRQSTAVAGRLICEGRPVGGVHVKLYDEDRTDIDDLMAEGYTDSRGYFYLTGYEDEITPIDPKLNIRCQRKPQIRIPDDYISHGQIPHKLYNLGVLNLDGEIEGEEHDCFN
ncbi:hypothetical protein M3Y99_01542400 [Aphelenchoides fujianensis]|nr:hypothetical protein M3Y99_01542400 [Aphelenchoides fujianensis]